MLSVNQVKLDLPYEKVLDENEVGNGHEESENEEEMDVNLEEKAEKRLKKKKKAKIGGNSECFFAYRNIIL